MAIIKLTPQEGFLKGAEITAKTSRGGLVEVLGGVSRGFLWVAFLELAKKFCSCPSGIRGHANSTLKCGLSRRFKKVKCNADGCESVVRARLYTFPWRVYCRECGRNGYHHNPQEVPENYSYLGDFHSENFAFLEGYKNGKGEITGFGAEAIYTMQREGGYIAVYVPKGCVVLFMEQGAEEGLPSIFTVFKDSAAPKSLFAFARRRVEALRAAHYGVDREKYELLYSAKRGSGAISEVYALALKEVRWEKGEGKVLTPGDYEWEYPKEVPLTALVFSPNERIIEYSAHLQSNYTVLVMRYNGRLNPMFTVHSGSLASQWFSQIPLLWLLQAPSGMTVNQKTFENLNGFANAPDIKD